MKKLVLAVCVAATLVAVSGIAPVHAAALSLSAQAAPQRPGATQTFTGTIAKTGDTFMLNDTDKKVSYSLDDAQQAAKYDGKKVTVTGTLDAQTKMIHVETIHEGS